MVPLEFKAVRDPIVKYLTEISWSYIEPDKCLELRGNISEPFLLSVLKQKIKELNKGVIDTDEQADEVIKKLRNVRANLAGNQEFLQYLRGEKTIYLEKEKREVNIKLIDFERPENNVFHVTKEFEFSDIKTDRADTSLFINGIPLGVIETKAPSVEDPIGQAHAQVRRYHAEMPELMKAVQFFALSEGIQLRFGPTWDLNPRNLHKWKIGEQVNLEKLVKDFFQKDKILRLLEDYIIFFTKDEELSKFVLDQHQMRATEKVVHRVVSEKLDSGLIWHTQGSGKSLTMIVGAHRLRKQTALENPTMLVVVDRTELESQMWRNLVSFGFPTCEIAQSKEHLQDLLKRDYRGLIVTTIQKFEGIEKDVSTRKNIIVLIDEAHRSQEGNLANYMRGALPQACYFGFTGTPIDKSNIGKGTFVIFGKHDPQGYLDKYSIKESIQDRTTVPLYYALAPQDLRVDRDLLEQEFFKLVEKEGVASIEELDKILERAVKLKNFLKADERVDKVAKFIAEHFKQFVEPLGLKAFIVAVDREGCALYKRAIDKYLPPDYSKVVFTQDQRDSELLKRFYLSEDEEENVRISFKAADKLPKILIVTQKLLTGFDAPVLYCMYLDKPFKDHTLLQAIARVNRPLDDESGEKKSSGLVMDFVGVLENLKRALTFDSATIEGALTDLSVLKEKFASLMKEAETYLAITKGGIDDKTLSAISERFVDTKERDKFSKLFKQIQVVYEILSPDPFLRDYLESYVSLTELYKIVQNMFRPEEVDLYRDLRNKTKELIRKHVNLESVIQNLPAYKIDDKVIDRLEKERIPEKAKVVNLYRSIVVHVQTTAKREPYLFSIGDAAEEVIRRFEERQIESKEALNKLMDIAKKIASADAERNQYKLTKDEYSIFWSLRENKVSNDIPGLSRGVLKLLQSNKTWPLNKKKEMEVRKGAYKLLLGKAPHDRLPAVVNSLLEMHRRMVAA
jgi:type I restriction enzyme R subunit